MFDTVFDFTAGETAQLDIEGKLREYDITMQKGYFQSICLGAIGGIPIAKVISEFKLRWQANGDQFDREINVPVGSCLLVHHPKCESIIPGNLLILNQSQVLGVMKYGTVDNPSRGIDLTEVENAGN